MRNVTGTVAQEKLNGQGHEHMLRDCRTRKVKVSVAREKLMGLSQEKS